MSAGDTLRWDFSTATEIARRALYAGAEVEVFATQSGSYVIGHWRKFFGKQPEEMIAISVKGCEISFVIVNVQGETPVHVDRAVAMLVEQYQEWQAQAAAQAAAKAAAKRAAAKRYAAKRAAAKRAAT
jgi:hypothetical protein